MTNTMKLTAIHKGTDREISMMVGKAMCAYANMTNASEVGMLNTAIALEAEYEATVRCIDMLVCENLYSIQHYIVNRADAELLTS